MDSLLQREIGQKRPFANRGELVFLNLVRTTEALGRAERDLLKAHGLSFAQYNVLRILRGAGDVGASCGEISERMVKRDPDVTRVLDRLVRRGLVTRDRREDDRRVVVGRITPEGLALLAELDEPLAEVHRAQTAHMEPADLDRLVSLLERLRSGG
jgi:DNA-binding MarR family transcriptional regulator